MNIKAFYYLHCMLDSDWLTNILRRAIIFQQIYSYELVSDLATALPLHITLLK